MMIKVRQSKDLPYTKEEIEKIAREALPSELLKAKGTIIIDWRSWPTEATAITWRSTPTSRLWHITISKAINHFFLIDEPFTITCGPYTKLGYSAYLEHETGRDCLAGILAHEFTHIKQDIDAEDRNSPRYEYYHKNFSDKNFSEAYKLITSPRPLSVKMSKTFIEMEREAERESRRIVEKEFWGRKKLRA